MPDLTLDELKDSLMGLIELASQLDLIDALRDRKLITDAEELVIKVRLRAQLREAVNAIPRENG